jgi:type I restriction enzyme S subunit
MVKIVRLKDVIELGNGRTRPTSSGTLPVFGGNGILGYTSDFNYDDELLIIGRVGAYCGSVYYWKGPVWISDNALMAKPKPGNCTRYFFYLLKQLDLNSFAEGSSHPLITQTLLNSLSLTVHSLEEQRAIAEVLSSLDDKIDLLHRQNKTLEQLAEVMFRQWFVEEAEEGWATGKIEDVCIRVGSGGTPPTKVHSYYNGDINWYSTKELNDSFLFDSSSKITQEGLENSAAKLFPENTVVIAIYAAPTVGRLGILANEASFNQAACGFVANEEKICFEFLYLHLLSSRQLLNDLASGSAQQNLNVGIMKSFQIPIPPAEVMLNFKQSIRPLFNKIKSNSIQIRTLTQLRDSLLPKLMSGEVRVNPN